MLSFLVNFLSHPVISGFTSAAAIIIGLSQLKHLLGIQIARGKVHETILAVGQHFSEINWTTFLIGFGAIVSIVALKKINKKIPAPLVVVLLGIGLVYFLQLNDAGVKIVESVPAGLPAFSVPTFSWESTRDLLPIALTISLVGFMESIAVAKAIQKKHNDYEVVPNQELVALGAANIGGAFFQAFPTTGGFSRTAVNDQAGAKTGMAALISALVVILTLLFLTPYFYYLPKAVLAAIIMVAVFGLIDFKEAKHLWKTDRTDFAMFIATALATLALGVEEGIAVGVILSLIMVIYRVSYPHVARLGRVPGTDQYRNVERYETVTEEPGVLIVRFDAPLFFANLGHFSKKLREMVQDRNDVEIILINGKAISGMDSSAVHAMEEMVLNYKKRGITIQLSGVRGPVRDIMDKAGLDDVIGRENIFLNVEDALKSRRGESVKANEAYVHQSN